MVLEVTRPGEKVGVAGAAAAAATEVRGASRRKEAEAKGKAEGDRKDARRASSRHRPVAAHLLGPSLRAS